MKRLTKLFPSLLAVGILASSLALPTLPAQAATDYSNSRMMDDAIFDNYRSMTEAEIQAFLTAKGPCLGGYVDVDPNYTKETGWVYGPTTVPVSHIIFKASQQWGINPQVILATLEKEESLVSGTSCDAWRYNSAMGYGCPDSGGCNPKYAGLTRQVLWGSWQLKFAKERSAGNTAWDGDGDITYTGYMTQGTYKRCESCTPNFYDGNATIDGQVIYLESSSTAAFYTYTPHLNQSFPGIFEKWFGSTIAANPPVAVYRVYNQRLNNHLLTTNVAERNTAVAKLGYRDEGIAFYDYPKSGEGLVPVYRLYSAKIMKHFYTDSDVERDNAVNQLGYTLEGVAFYAYPNTGAGLAPLYRVLDPRTGKHLWTSGQNEVNVLTTQQGWINENIGWYTAL